MIFKRIKVDCRQKGPELSSNYIPHFHDTFLPHCHVARLEEGRSAFKMLMGKLTGKRPLGRPRRRWEDNIRMDLEVIGTNTRNWVGSAQDRDYWRALVNTALNLRVP